MVTLRSPKHLLVYEDWVCGRLPELGCSIYWFMSEMGLGWNV